MKTLIFAILLILPLVSKDQAYSEEQSKSEVAVIDMEMLFQSHPKRNEIKEKLENIKKQSYENITKEKEQITKLEEEFEKRKHSLNGKDFRFQLGNIESKKEQLRKLILKENKYLDNYEQQLKKPLLKEIFYIINKLRKDKGYSIIMHKEDVIAFDKKIDLTYEAVKRIKEAQ